MKRRSVLAAAGPAVACLPSLVMAQSAAKLVRIGWIVATSEQASVPFLKALRAGLTDLGYVEGRSFAIEARYGNDQPSRVAALLEELERLPVDIIVTQGVATWTVVGFRTTTPVVYVFSADPVEAGFARNLAQPTGNATGLTLMSVELNGKRLQLLREFLPALRRVAIIANPDHRGETLERRNSEEMARQLDIDVRYLPAHTVGELEQSFTAVAAEASEAIVVFPDPLVIQNRQRIIDFAMGRGIPVVSGWAVFAQSGALCTYGPRLTESYRRAAYYVDRILKGARPADVPIERPTVFELVINLKTAKALNLSIAPTLLARADEVIE